MKKMLRLLTLLISFPFNPLPAWAQVPADTISGEYHLQGVMETASAILLKPDKTFELYFSYGSMDRQGKGQWRMEANRIILNSKPWPKTDFAMVNGKALDDNFVTVKISSSNQQILPHFEVMLRTSDGEKYGKTNGEGIYQIPKSKVNSIELFFTFCPERYSTFAVMSDDNYFEFKIEPWITEVFLDNTVLNVDPAGLRGEHPLLKGNDFLYTKAK